MSERGYILAIFIFIIGCSKDPQEVNIYSIPDEFRLDMHQAVSNEGSQPAFKISTIESRMCIDDKIIVTISKIGQNIGIDILSIDKAPECNGLPGRISTDVYAFMQPGTYNIQVILKDQIKNDGRLTVDEEQFSLSLSTDHGLELGQLNIKKIPDQLIWGYVGIEERSTDPLDQTLYEALLPYMSQISAIEKGDYGLFSINNEGEIIFDDLGNLILQKKFLMKMEGSKTDISKVVEEFKDNHPGYVVKIFTSRGVIS